MKLLSWQAAFTHWKQGQTRARSTTRKRTGLQSWEQEAEVSQQHQAAKLPERIVSYDQVVASIK